VFIREIPLNWHWHFSADRMIPLILDGFQASVSDQNRTDDSHSFYIHRIIVGNGIVEFFRHLSRNIYIVRRIWIPRSLEADTRPDWRSHGSLSSSLQSIIIPRSVELLCSSCFSHCKSLSSITFESNSWLTRIESSAFSNSSLQSLIIPRNIEFLCSSCFSYCHSFSSITFESDSRLTRIESSAFSNSSFQSIIIPRSVQFIDGSAFDDVKIDLISIEAGNTIFEMMNAFLIDILSHKLI
jgi:hypothetical protein